MSQIDMTSSEVHKNLFRLSVPVLGLTLLSYLGMFVNLGWLAILSDEQHLPEIFRLVSLIVGVLAATFTGLLSAVYIYANQAYGRKDHANASHLINYGFGLCLLLGLCVSIFGDLLSQQLLSVFGVDEVIKLQAKKYLNVLWIGYIFILLNIYGGLLSKMAGDTRMMVRFQIVSFVVDMVCTPLLIVLAIHYNFNVVQATAVAMLVACCSGLFVLLRDFRDFPYRISVAFWPARGFTENRAMLKLAVAETLNGFSLNFSFFLFFIVISYYEASTIVAVTSAQYVMGFFHSLLVGMVAALIPFTAQNIGAKNLSNIKIGVQWMCKRVLLVALAVGALIIIFAPYLIERLAVSPTQAVNVLSYIRISSLPWAFLIASFPYIFAVIGMGDTKGTMLLTFWSMYLSNLLPMYLVLHFVGDSTSYAAYAESAAHLLTFVGCFLYYRYKMAELERTWHVESPSLLSMPVTA